MVKYIQTNRRRFIEETLTQCFAVNIAEFLRTPILKNICLRLPLNLP